MIIKLVISILYFPISFHILYWIYILKAFTSITTLKKLLLRTTMLPNYVI